MADGDVIKSQGTKLYFVKPGTNMAVMSVTCPTGIDGLGGAADQIDVTCLEDQEERQFVAGLNNPGQVTVPFNLHEGDASHDELFALKDSKERIWWGAYSSGNVTAPAIDTNGELQPVAGRVSLRWFGYVSDLTIAIGANDIWKGTLTIQRSGSIKRDLGV